MGASLRYRAAMAAYQAALWAAAPLIWRYFRRRAAGDAGYGEALGERRGDGKPFDADVWVHAVSLGEFRSAEPAIRELVQSGRRVVVTHATPAGRRASEAALAREISEGRITVRWAPVDREVWWRRFFQEVAPKVGLVFEMEFWPGMAEAAQKEGVALWFVNAQVPEKSFSRALRVKAVLGAHPAARSARVLAKSERMAARFRALGAGTADAFGETRFDIPPPASQVEAGAALKAKIGDRAVVSFASVVGGEEPVYLDAAAALAGREDRPLVIWVPRAPELFDATHEMLTGAGLRVARRSEVIGEDLSPFADLTDVDVLLGDSFGEMFYYLAAADAVSVGGGFVEKGAHNVIEPLALGKPVVTGPHIWTIEFPGREALDAGLLTVVDDADALARTLMASGEVGPDRAEAFHRSMRGASGRIVSEVLAFLEEADA